MDNRRRHLRIIIVVKTLLIEQGRITLRCLLWNINRLRLLERIWILIREEDHSLRQALIYILSLMLLNRLTRGIKLLKQPRLEFPGVLQLLLSDLRQLPLFLNNQLLFNKSNLLFQNKKHLRFQVKRWVVFVLPLKLELAHKHRMVLT